MRGGRRRQFERRGSHSWDVNVNPDQPAGVKSARAVAEVAGVEVLTELVGRLAAGELAALPAPGGELTSGRRGAVHETS